MYQQKSLVWCTSCEHLHLQDMGSGQWKDYSIPTTLWHNNFHAVWIKADQALWKAAQSLDRAGRQDLAAKQFGLVDPNDPNRPSFTQNPFQVHERSKGSYPQDTMVVPPTPPQPFVESIPVATTINSVVKSEHTFISVTKGSKLKEKVKTQGMAAPI